MLGEQLDRARLSPASASAENDDDGEKSDAPCLGSRSRSDTHGCSSGTPSHPPRRGSVRPPAHARSQCQSRSSHGERGRETEDGDEDEGGREGEGAGGERKKGTGTHLEQDVVQLLEEVVVEHLRLLRGQGRVPELRGRYSVLVSTAYAYVPGARPGLLANAALRNMQPFIAAQAAATVQRAGRADPRHWAPDTGHGELKTETHLARGVDEGGPLEAGEEAAEEVRVEVRVAQLDGRVLEAQREVVRRAAFGVAREQVVCY